MTAEAAHFPAMWHHVLVNHDPNICCHETEFQQPVLTL